MLQETSRVNEATWSLYRALLEGAFAAQEQYLKLALNGVGPVEIFRNQSEINRHTMETVAEQSRRQWEAFQTLADELSRTYADLFYASIPYAPSSSYSRDNRCSKDAS